MFDATTDEWIFDWPYSVNKAFDDCDLDRDGKVNDTETELCYNKECVRSCSTQADRDARTDTWCECRTKSFEIVIEQFDSNGDGLDIDEFALIYDNSLDNVNIDFAVPTIQKTYEYTEPAADDPTTTAFCLETRMECDASGIC